MKFQPRLFLKEALLFGSMLALGMFVAYRYVLFLSGIENNQPVSLNINDVAVFALAIFVIWLIGRVPRLARWVFWTLISFVVLSGAQIVIASFAPFPVDIIGSFVVLGIFLCIRNVLVHDISIGLGIAGIGGVVGIMISPMSGVVALVLLSFYDIIAVYKTKHMVQMAQTMIASGAVFGFIIPPTFKLFFAPQKEAHPRVGTDFMILGSGDIGLPLIFVCSLLRHSLLQAIIVGCFAMIGLCVTHVLFVNQTKRHPMAALPPIATLTLVGYALALVLV